MPVNFPVGYAPAAAPSPSTVGLLWFWSNGTTEKFLSLVAVPGSDPVVLAGKLASGSWVILDGTSGIGVGGQTIAPDPNWSTSTFVYVSDSGNIFSARTRAEVPDNVPAQVITYTPSGSPKWTAKKLP